MTPGEVVRAADLARIEKALANLDDGQKRLDGKVTEMRVAMAENYVRRADLDTIRVELRSEMTGDIAGLHETVAEHAKSDDSRFSALQKMVWGLMAGVLATFGGVIALLVVEALRPGRIP